MDIKKKKKKSEELVKKQKFPVIKGKTRTCSKCEHSHTLFEENCLKEKESLTSYYLGKTNIRLYDKRRENRLYIFSEFFSIKKYYVFHFSSSFLTRQVKTGL